MIITIIYLIFMLILYISTGVTILYGNIFQLPDSIELIVLCGLVGGIGGITYCLRGVYLNASVYNRWSTVWIPWYFLRPIVSIITGAVSCLFLQAGLIVLEATKTTSSTHLVYYALAFIAGLNVDKFIQKIEEIAEVTWGIKKSRTSGRGEKENND